MYQGFFYIKTDISCLFIQAHHILSQHNISLRRRRTRHIILFERAYYFCLSLTFRARDIHEIYLKNAERALLSQRRINWKPSC